MDALYPPLTQMSAAGNADLTAEDHRQLLAALAYADLRVRWGVARARAGGLDPDDEFRGLYISDAQIDALLQLELGQHTLSHAPLGEAWLPRLAAARQNWLAQLGQGRLAALWQRFELTDAEMDALLLALLPELDPRYERIFAYLQDDVTKKRPTVDLLLNLLTDSFRDKLSLQALFRDDGRLVQSRLVVRFRDGAAAQPPLLSQFVRPAPQVVAYLLGYEGLDSQLAECGWLSLAVEMPASSQLPPTVLQPLAAAAVADTPPLLAFIGGYGVGKQAAASYVAGILQTPLITLDLAAMPAPVADLLPVALRDGRLLNATIYLSGWDSVLQDGAAPLRLLEMLLAYPGVVMVGGETLWQPREKRQARPVHTVLFERPDYAMRVALWQEAIDGANLNVTAVANHFQFTPGQIRDAAATARDLAGWEQTPLSLEHLFTASRTHSNQKLTALATKIQPRHQWADIILPPDTLRQLQELVNMVRFRPLVYGQWHFGDKMALGKGLNALFAGDSGTGKTMAADIIAHELGLDLYKINLSTVVSKYIGETEKNLSRIFHEAETSNAVLFFDEADALFGKRSEVKDSHDRYANIEISYLLQRMEAFAGIVILATNLRANLDDAFTRRLHFIIEFPFPEVADRQQIWRVNTPAGLPLAADVNFNLLAERFRLAGGNIRNILLAAAFLAAEEGGPVAMMHLLHAARREYQKMGRLINETLFTL